LLKHFYEVLDGDDDMLKHYRAVILRVAFIVNCKNIIWQLTSQSKW